MIDGLEIKDQVIEKAFELGFTEIGFAPYDTLDQEIEHYKDWIQNNYHADMAWMENNLDKRRDPREILSECNSVIVLLTNYKTDHQPKDVPGKGKMARYSWGKDYHKTISKRLKKLERYLFEINSSIKTRSYVDTGAVLERQWAVRAGLGWQGKNTLLLNRKLGSYFFISVIFTDLKFPEPKIIKDHCGKCNKCIEECPTNAIFDNYSMNASKCISYWTIESKVEEIPSEISNAQSNWVFGCDICQEVCPWNNHRTPITLDPYFQPRNNETELDLKDLLNMEQDEFTIRFQNSPVKRPKLMGMKRNANSLLTNDES